MAKGAFRADWAPEWSGGWLVPLHKGQGSVNAFSLYRGILFEPVMARVISRAWRHRYEQGLQQIASVMQYGGRRGLSLESLRLQVKMWQSNGAATCVSTGMLFLDIQAAFYSAAKPLLSGWSGDVQELQKLFATMGLPATAFPAFLGNVMEGSIVFAATGSRICQDHIETSLRRSWFTIPGGSKLLAPATGSRRQVTPSPMCCLP